MAQPLHLHLLRRQLNPFASSRHIRPEQTCTALCQSRSPRPFHATQIRPASSAARPAARQTPHIKRQNKHKEAYKGDARYINPKNGRKLDRDGFCNFLINGDWRSKIETFRHHAHLLHETALKDDFIPPAVKFEMFKTASEKLIEASHTQSSTASAATSISIDVDALFRIAIILRAVPGCEYIWEWTTNACTRAKSRRAVVQHVQRYIQLPGVDIHRNTEWIALVKDFALIDGFPPAIYLHAKILACRGQHAEAASLLEEKILPFIKPVQKMPGFCEDITLRGELETPLRLYGLCIAETQGVEAASKVMRDAALDYFEPQALQELAVSYLAQDNFDKYEEYMSMAASACSFNACFHLANFYLRISRGEFPTRQETVAARMKAQSPKWLEPLLPWRLWMDSLINKDLDRSKYESLAKDWYDFAYEGRHETAGLILALLFREKGKMKKSRAIFDDLDRVQLSKTLPLNIILKLKSNWADPSFKVELPRKIMTLG